jgi:L-arabonate dehydrase
MSEADFQAAEAAMSRSKGHCMTMGTASTMACMVEALGLTLPGKPVLPLFAVNQNCNNFRC